MPALVAFILSLLLSFVIFTGKDDSGNLTMTTHLARLVFVAIVTIATHVLAARVTADLEAKRQVNAEIERRRLAAEAAAERGRHDRRRKAKRRAKKERTRAEEERASKRRDARIDAARNYVTTLKARLAEHGVQDRPSGVDLVPDTALAHALWAALPPSVGQARDPDSLTEADLASISGTLVLQDETIESLEGIQHAVNLDALHLAWLEKVSDLGPVGRLYSLNALSIRAYRGMPSLTSLDSLVHLDELHTLELVNLSGVQDLRVLSALAGLSALHLAQTSESLSLDGLSAVHLDRLTINSLPRSVDLEPIGDVRSLTHVMVNDTAHFGDLRLLRHLCSLAELDIRNCGQVGGTKSLRRLRGLRRLAIKDSRIAALDSVLRLSSLETLELQNVGKVRSIAALGSSARISSLNLHVNTAGALDLDPLGSLNSLRRLSLDVTDFEHLGALAELSQLAELDICVARALDDHDFERIANLRHLVNLSVRARSLGGYPRLTSNTTITTLTLAGDVYENAATLSNLRDLRHMPRLRSLTLEHVNGLELRYGVAELTGLESLTLHNVELAMPESLGELHTLTALTSLSIDGCRRIKPDLSALAALAGLQEVHLGRVETTWNRGDLASRDNVRFT